MSVLPRHLALTCALAAVLSGCSSGRNPAVETAIEDFGSSWGARDGARVCELLSPEARSEVADTRGEPCRSGVLREQLPEPAAVSSVEVWGDGAQVRTATDTVFLAQFDTGWKVTAVGCSQRPGKPYDCVIGGG